MGQWLRLGIWKSEKGILLTYIFSYSYEIYFSNPSNPGVSFCFSNALISLIVMKTVQ